MAAVADPRPRNRAYYGAIAALLSLSLVVQVVRDRGWQPYQPENSVMWLRAGPITSRLALGFDNLVADVYWMRAIIYFGNKTKAADHRPNYDLLYPLLEMVTTLDPDFRVAYRFGAIFLAEAYPKGPGSPDLAIRLLERGLAHDPARWEYAEDIGFIHYWWLQNYDEAARWFADAGERPGAPDWLKPLAATTLARGNNRESSRMLWTQMLESDVEYIRTSARHRLSQLDAMDTIDKLAAIVQRFIERQGRPPQSWQELAAAERLRGIPLDSTGQPFELDPSSGRISVSRKSILWPLPTETPGPAAPPS
jgi:hypothetical protein